MLRKEKFAPGEYYHIYSRTILNTPGFKNNKNADRLAQAFLLANSTKSSEAFRYLRNTENAQLERAIEIAREGEKFVNVLCYCIMPDHYHLLLEELKDNGITNFVRKCNTSIAKYVNIKTNRLGPLFESRFKAKHINTNEYLLHLSVYIHLNPLDIISGKEWREHKLKNWDITKKELLLYPWSSLKYFLNRDYKNPIISGEEIILKQFNNKKEYELFLREWSEETLSKIDNIIID